MEGQALEKLQEGQFSDVIKQALLSNANLEALEKLLQLQKDWEANEARKLFASAFARAQAGIEAVVKTKLNPQTHSKYAELSNIIEETQPIYTAEGFSMMFYEGDTALQNHVRVCVDILHTAGHKETRHLDVPLDGEGIKGNANMTRIHGKSSSVAYGRRYLMCMIWNIPTADNDGNTAEKTDDRLDEKQVKQVKDKLVEVKKLKPSFEEKNFLDFFNADSIERIRKADFPNALQALETAKRVQK